MFLSPFHKKSTREAAAVDEEPVEITSADYDDAVQTPPRPSAPKDEFSVILDVGEDDATPISSSVGVLIYIAMWVASLLAPLILFALYRSGRYLLFTILVAAVVAAYAPDDVIPRLEGLRQWFRETNPRYFKSARVVLEKPLDEGKPTVLCSHPHGIFCLGWGQLFLMDELKHVYFCFSSALFLTPFFRLFTRVLGRPGSVSKDAVLSFMKQGKSIALIPGGFEDATLHSPDVDRVFLKSRKGFVKYALQFGYSLTPAFSFGERKSFDNVQGNYDFRFKLNSVGIPAIVPYGDPRLPLLPKRVPIEIVVGAPLELPKIEKPAPEDVDKYHQMYIDHLIAFYNRHKEAFYGDEAVDLEIW